MTLHGEKNGAGGLVPTREQLDQLRLAREGAILRKWTAGRVLSPEEMSVVAHVLPATILANPPAPRLSYRHDYQFYADAIGFDVRNIKRLVAKGKAARSPCPLDEPWKLQTWWDELRERGFVTMRCSQKLADYSASNPPPVATVPDLQASAGQTVAGHPGANPAANVTPGAASSSPAATANDTAASSVAGSGAAAGAAVPNTRTGQKVNFGSLSGVGIESAVEELRIQLSANREALREAQVLGENDVIVSRRKKHFEDTLDSLMRTEVALQKLMEARGDLAPVSEFRADLAVILSTLRTMMRKRAANIVARLESAKFTAEQLALVRAALDAEAAREEVQFRSARHWRRAPDGSVILDG